MSGVPVTDGTGVYPGAAVARPPGKPVGWSRGTSADRYRLARWYVCRTRSRAEKRVDQRLRAVGFESYLPLIEREHRWADRKKRVALPLFPGYVFARFSLTELPRLLRTPGLAAVLQLEGRPWPLRPGELESVRALVDGANRSGVEPSPSDYFAAGQEVMVVAGPFQGMRGRLHEMRGRTRVIVQLSAIRQAVMVDMERHLLQPIRIGESDHSGSVRNLPASSGACV